MTTQSPIVAWEQASKLPDLASIRGSAGVRSAGLGAEMPSGLGESGVSS